MRKFNQKNNNGFTLIEMVVYIALMTVILLAIIQSLITVLKSGQISFAEINIRNSGYSAMERMIREISSSENIIQISNGSLELSKDNGGSFVKFEISPDNILNFYEGSGTPIFIGPLTLKSINVKNLIFNKIDTGKSLAVRIQMELETIVKGQTKNEWFYSTAILRGSY